MPPEGATEQGGRVGGARRGKNALSAVSIVFAREGWGQIAGRRSFRVHRAAQELPSGGRREKITDESRRAPAALRDSGRVRSQ